jgi:peptide deformylase
MEEVMIATADVNDIVKAVQDNRISDEIVTGVEKRTSPELNPETIQNAMTNEDDHRHMDTTRLTEVAKGLGLMLSPPNEVEGAECEEMTIEDITQEHIDRTRNMLKLLAEINGLGLAAPQIGIKKKFMVYWDARQNTPYVCYNPKYYPDGHQTAWAEKCLTYGELTFAVKRYKAIRAVWWEYDPDKEQLVKQSKTLKGLQGEVFQHETDHLEGKTIAQIGVLLK